MADHSEEIGYLKAKVDSLGNQSTELFKKHDQTIEILGDIKTILNTHVKSSEMRHDDIEDDIKEVSETVAHCKTGVDDYYKVKTFGMWFAGIVAFIWTGIWKVLDKIGLS